MIKYIDMDLVKNVTFTSLRHKEGYIEECRLLLKLQRHLGDLFLIKRTETVREYGRYFCCDFVCYIGDEPIFFLELKARNGITELPTLMINESKLRKCIERSQINPTAIIFIWKNKDIKNQYFYKRITDDIVVNAYGKKVMPNGQMVRFIPKDEMERGGIEDLCQFIKGNYK